MSDTTNQCIDTCNSLLRGEISAVETYTQAIEKFAGDSAAARLSEARDRHRESVQDLQANVARMGGVPDTDSGLWGDFAKAVEGSAKLLGENAALTALQAGENFGQGEYESAVEGDTVMPECKSMILEELLPRVIKNQELLEQIKDAN